MKFWRWAENWRNMSPLNYMKIPWKKHAYKNKFTVMQMLSSIHHKIYSSMYHKIKSIIMANEFFERFDNLFFWIWHILGIRTYRAHYVLSVFLSHSADLKSSRRSHPGAHPPLQHQSVQGEVLYELHNCPIPLYTFAPKIWTSHLLCRDFWYNLISVLVYFSHGTAVIALLTSLNCSGPPTTRLLTMLN